MSLLSLIFFWFFPKYLLYIYISFRPCAISKNSQLFHYKFNIAKYSVQFSSVDQSCLTFCDPMDCSRSGFPVRHQLPEFIQTHVHRIGDAIQPFHPLLSPSPPAFNLSQHQGLFKWVSSSYQVAKSTGVSASTSVLPVNIQDWFPPGWTGLILQSKGLSRVFSNTTVQKHQFGAQLLYCEYKLNKQGDNIQPWRTPVPIWKQSVSNIYRSYHRC